MSVSLAPRLTARRSVEDLRALAEEGARALRDLEADEATSGEVIDWVSAHFSTDAVAVACSMADAVLPHLVSSRLPGVDVLFLDTGYHFLETRVTRDEVERSLDVRLVDVLPEQTVAEQDAQFDITAMQRLATVLAHELARV